MPADATLRDYLATIEQSERRRYHDEGEGWTCVPTTEAANNMAGLWDEAAHSTGLSVDRLRDALLAADRAIGMPIESDADIDHYTAMAIHVAAEYARLPTPEPGPDARQEGEDASTCTCQAFPGVGYPHRTFCAISLPAAQPEGEPR